MGHWESSVEKQIRKAMEEGAFDDLPGKGKPIDLSENPFADPDLRTVHRLLRDAGFAPAFIEERKAIDAALEGEQTTLARAWNLRQRASHTYGEASWLRALDAFRERVSELNQRIRLHNLKVPAAAFQRKLIDVEMEIERARKASQ
jgi:DnaJ homolog subfamily C member 28